MVSTEIAVVLLWKLMVWRSGMASFHSPLDSLPVQGGGAGFTESGLQVLMCVITKLQYLRTTEVRDKGLELQLGYRHFQSNLEAYGVNLLCR